MRKLLEDALKSGDASIVVDFAGMKITSVSFFDESFGTLAKRYGEDLLKKFDLAAIDPFDLHLVRDIVSSRTREQKLSRQSAR
jgi:hypothetical protein